MIGYSVGGTVMMQLGGYQFTINTAAYQELTRKTEYRWAQQDVYGQRPALQFTGPGAETMTLQGTIYTEFRGGVSQIEAMKSQAGYGIPLILVSGYGKLLGRWVIESIEETQTVFAAGGRPRKQEFTLQLRRFE